MPLIFRQKWFRGSLIATALVLPLLGLGLRGGLARAYVGAMPSPADDQTTVTPDQTAASNSADKTSADKVSLASADKSDTDKADGDNTADNAKDEIASGDVSNDSSDDVTADDLVADNLSVGDEQGSDANDNEIAANFSDQDDADQ